MADFDLLGHLGVQVPDAPSPQARAPRTPSTPPSLPGGRNILSPSPSPASSGSRRSSRILTPGIKPPSPMISPALPMTRAPRTPPDLQPGIKPPSPMRSPGAAAGLRLTFADAIPLTTGLGSEVGDGALLTPSSQSSGGGSFCSHGSHSGELWCMACINSRLVSMKEEKKRVEARNDRRAARRLEGMIRKEQEAARLAHDQHMMATRVKLLQDLADGAEAARAARLSAVAAERARIDAPPGAASIQPDMEAARRMEALRIQRAQGYQEELRQQIEEKRAREAADRNAPHPLGEPDPYYGSLASPLRYAYGTPRGMHVVGAGVSTPERNAQVQDAVLSSREAYRRELEAQIQEKAAAKRAERQQEIEDAGKRAASEREAMARASGEAAAADRARREGRAADYEAHLARAASARAAQRAGARGEERDAIEHRALEDAARAREAEEMRRAQEASLLDDLRAQITAVKASRARARASGLTATRRPNEPEERFGLLYEGPIGYPSASHGQVLPGDPSTTAPPPSQLVECARCHRPAPKHQLSTPPPWRS